MTDIIKQFGLFLRERAEVDMDELVSNIMHVGPTYGQQDHAELYDSIHQTFMTLAASIAEDDPERMTQYLRQLSERQASGGFSMREILDAVSVMRDRTWQHYETFMQNQQPWIWQDLRRLNEFFHAMSNMLALGFGEVLREVRANLEAQEMQLAAQRQTIRDLGSPILPVYQGILVLPLVGAVDSYRASQVMEDLLQAITDQQADLVIVDITGVPVVDTNVANYLLQAARAAQLVGATVILVGIGAEIAQTIVQLGVDLSGIVIYANLQEGIQYALARVGRKIV